MKRVGRYLNPLAHLGERQYSFFFPLFLNLSVCILSESFAYNIAKDPNIIGAYIIYVNFAIIIYCAFRDGIKGGITATIITIAYYFYIILTRHYTGQKLIDGIDATVILGILYFLLAGIIGWLKVSIDTLIDREADEKRRLQAIVQQLPVGVLITDNQGRIVQANKQVDTILGVKVPLGHIAGSDKPLIPSTVDGKIVRPTQSPLAQAISTGKASIRKEFVIQRKNNKNGYLLVSTSPIHNKAGKVIAAASILHDITQQKEMEARKDDFVNMASHELKTPITSMKLYIDVLINSLKIHNDPKANKILKNIQNQTVKLQELVNDLLDVSRLQTGKLSFNKEQFNIDELVVETIEGLQEAAKQPIIFSNSVQTKVYADRFRIYQVLTNLITNAIKYSPEEKKITIRIKHMQGMTVISVKDYGIGIVKEEQKKIFDRLYQVTDVTEKTFPGLGMGLYISKEIITRHKGRIWVESEKGKGATFYFSLPTAVPAGRQGRQGLPVYSSLKTKARLSESMIGRQGLTLRAEKK